MTRAHESEKQLERDELNLDLSDLEIEEALRPMTSAGPRETILVDETDIVLLDDAASDPVLPTSSESALQEELASLSHRRSTPPRAPHREARAPRALQVDAFELDSLVGITTERMPHSLLAVPAAQAAAGRVAPPASTSMPSPLLAFAPPATLPPAHLHLANAAPAPPPRRSPSVVWLFGAAMVGVLCTLGATRALRGSSSDARAPAGSIAAAEAPPTPSSVTMLTSASATTPSAVAAATTEPAASALAGHAPPRASSAPVSAPSAAPSGTPQRAAATAAATSRPSAAPHVTAAPVARPAPAPVARPAPAPITTPPHKRALTPAEELAEAQLKASMR